MRFTWDRLSQVTLVVPIVARLEWTGFGTLRHVLPVAWSGMLPTLLRSLAEHRADLP